MKSPRGHRLSKSDLGDLIYISKAEIKVEGVSLGSFVFWRLLLERASHVPVAGLPWLLGDALI